MTQIHRVMRVEEPTPFWSQLPGCPRQTPDELTISLASLHDLLRAAPNAPLGARLAIRPGHSRGAVSAVLTWETPAPAPQEQP